MVKVINQLENIVKFKGKGI